VYENTSRKSSESWLTGSLDCLEICTDPGRLPGASR
jgi:hypothetical protein